ncbi:hypothetical protein DI272_18955 [Streptomyces sp. Act143]|uniref:hypothetical protein n=1 Tax=Streptomyces sp. Act143 TaxID=2200760 RepID=UPI000D678AEB|nr:hypothetical protein [Streptomyces sp. Act143]PWI16013.1 hypothetical protein DI272_18955 [Streptomyces sp. Act143]
MERLPHLHHVRPDWPLLAAPGEFLPDDQPVPADQWPTLNLRWWETRPVVLPFDEPNGAVTGCLLEAVGAPAPVALVSYRQEPGARRGRWVWRCEVHVITGETVAADGFNFDCPTIGRTGTTRDGARESAAAHIASQHPDAAVPYLGRRQHALRRWA